MAVSKGELIDSHVSAKQLKLAVDALHSHQTAHQKKLQDNELLPGKEQHIWLSVGVKKMYPEHKVKPFRIPIVHPLVDPRYASICLITKDPQREYKNLLEEHKVKFISRVVGITKLKGKFKPFEARRALLKENGMFLADERVTPLLPGLLGKKWFEAKKQPIPVCLTRKDLKGELERAISSTYMHQNQGTCTSIKVANLSHTPAQIIDNIKLALPAIITNIKDGWDNIQSLHIKTNSSMSLPVWTCNLADGEGGRWAGMGVEPVPEESEDEGVEMEAEEPVKASQANSEKPKKIKGTAKVKAVSEDDSDAPTAPTKAKPKPKYSPVADSDAPPATKTKKRKAGVAGDDNVPVPSTSKTKSLTILPQSTSTDSKSDETTHKKKKQRKSEEPPPVLAVPSVTEAVAEMNISKKKKNKEKAAITPASPPPPSTSATAAGTSSQKPKKEKKAKPAQDTSAATPIPAEKGKRETATPALVVSEPSEHVDDAAPAKKQRKKEKTAAVSFDEADTISSATALPGNTMPKVSDIKAKRKGEASEIKKEKVRSKDGKGKSVKDKMLGIKAAMA